jgi:CBS domain-containing protein
MSLSRFRKSTAVAAEDQNVSTVARTMRELHVGCVVITRGTHPVGIVTDRDIALRIVAEALDPESTRVSEIVTYDPVVVSESDGIETVAARMREHGVRRLPIVDATGAVVGMVTADDIMVLLGRELASLCAGIEESSDACDSR